MLTFAGFPLLEKYTHQAEQEILAYLIDISSKTGRDPKIFYNQSDNRNVVQLELEPRVLLKIGKITSFSKEEIAMIIFEQSKTYAHRATMGMEFPVGDKSLEIELLAEFIQDIDDVYVISLQYNKDGYRKILGGCFVSTNDSNSMILDTCIDLGRESHVPVFRSLRAKSLPADTMQVFQGVLESEILSPIRFWRQDNNLMDTLGIKDYSYSRKIVASIPAVISHISGNGSLKGKKYALVDTHDARVGELIQSVFSAKLFASSNNLFSTPEVLSSILKYHYSNIADGGYFENINIYYFELNEFLQKSKAIFPELYQLHVNEYDK